MSKLCQLLIVVLSVLVLSLATAVPAFAEGFTFESRPSGFRSPSLTSIDKFLSLTVTTDVDPKDLVAVESAEVASVDSSDVVGSTANVYEVNNFARLRFSFSKTGNIIFAFDESVGDDDSSITIQAFNASNVLLGTWTESYPADSLCKTFSGSFAGAAYFIVSSGKAGNNKEGLWSELESVTTSVAAIAEPTTMMLLGTGLAGVAVSMRRRRQLK